MEAREIVENWASDLDHTSKEEMIKAIQEFNQIPSTLLEQAREEAEKDYYGTDYLDAKDKQEIFLQGAQFIINQLNELKTK